MPTFILFILIGLAGGVLGGAGMGGGTLLIPLLVLFTGLGQHAAQAVNLLAFIPMSVIALIIHAKNGLVKFRYFFGISLPAALTAAAAAYFVRHIAPQALKIGFGIFLAVVGVIQFLFIVIRIAKDKKAEKARKSPQS
jgi:uncharacterized membrane protein YfcA